MAGLYMKGHFALASLPVSGKPRGFHTSPWSSMSITTAKAGPKLETRVLEEPDTGEPTMKIRVSEKSERGRKPALDSKKKIRALVTEEPTLASGMEDVELENPGTMENRVSEEEDTEEPDGEDMNLEFSAVEEMDADMDMFVPPGAVLSEEKPLRRLPGSNIYLGPFANNSRVKQAEFVKSSSGVADCPDAKLPEFALVGRSNVGKSSLINSLVQRKDLAQTSKKPGKTQLINHFIINKSWYLVDLPGYGYAKVPTVIRTSWDGFTKEFFLHSKSLVCVMLLIDATIPPQQIDLEYAAWLRQNKVPLTIVFTKCDRKKKKKNGGRKPEENLKDFLRLLKSSLEQLPPWIMTSCVTNQGKDALLMHMAQLRNYWSS